MKPSEKMAELGISLPSVSAPVGSYVPAKKAGSLVFTSGQLPFRNGTLTCTGKVGTDITTEKASDGAAAAILNALAAVAQVAGGIDRIKEIVRVCVFVNSSPGFVDQPKVANGASDLLTAIFRDSGRHVRSAVGVAELPLDAAVELELIAEVAT